jgi:ABC-2 type transport system permease protein
MSEVSHGWHHRPEHARKNQSSRLATPLRVMRAALGVARKDLRSARAERAFMFTTIIIPINYLILFAIIAASGARAPIALVMDDNGPAAQSLLHAMRTSNSFVVHVVDDQKANSMFDQGTAVAVVTFPPTIDADIAAGRQVTIPVTINNLNVDFTDDIRRALPLSINTFVAAKYPDQLPVQTQELDLHPHEPGYLQYVAVSSVVIAVAIGGMLPAGTIAAREYETGTLKALLLAPPNRAVVQCGRVMAGIVLGTLPVVALLAITIGLIGLRPVHPQELAVATAVVMVLFVSIGNLVGNLVRRRPAVIPLCAGIATPLFAVGGAFIPVSWEHPVVTVAAHFSPTYYGLALFQHAFYGVASTPQGFAVNLAVLVAAAAGVIALTTWMMARYEVAH